MMELWIFDLDEHDIDKFISQDTDRYARILRPATDKDPTVDLIIKVKTFAVDSEHLIFEFPNNGILAVQVPSFHYHKIEVM